jgi:hypothetical protein
MRQIINFLFIQKFICHYSIYFRNIRLLFIKKNFEFFNRIYLFVNFPVLPELFFTKIKFFTKKLNWSFIFFYEISDGPDKKLFFGKNKKKNSEKL